MRLISSLTGRFSERNLVLHGLLGLLSASNRLMGAWVAEPNSHTKLEACTSSNEDLAGAPALAFAVLGLLALSSKLREELSPANDSAAISAGEAHPSSGSNPGLHHADLLR
jgi:hypothetical protein